jgi:hypothetical protein
MNRWSEILRAVLLLPEEVSAYAIALIGRSSSTGTLHDFSG